MANHPAPHGNHTHPFHLVDPSPWPALGSGSLFTGALGAAMYMHKVPGGVFLLAIGFALVLYTMYVWWRDVIKESRVDNAHTKAVSHGLRLGMVLFITSEVLFFAAFFWAFFDASMLPKAPLEDTWAIKDGVWPPAGIRPFNAFELPFLNTLILLLSGTTVTWAHYCIINGNRKDSITALWYTVILGAIFTTCQAYEYSHAAFGFKDGIYASTFYMATGFHGFHVLVGTLFLAICLGRAKKGHFTPEKHLGFEFAAWYWHFVDVVWLFLFVFVYCDMGNFLMPAFQAIFTGTNLLIAFALSFIAAGVIGFQVLAKGGMNNAMKPGHH
ncbi:MAG: cytochrome c oxidase subunit 3 [Rickettsiales bacterium]|nr:cytochrome c oxidase subunit 3 [Rickettsiales bacterium]